MVAETEKAARKILVTGSNGMLGFDLCRELERRCAVWGIDLPRRSPGSIRRDRFLEKDLTDKAATLEAFSRIRPDVVIHAAAWTDVDGCESDPDKAFRINAEATGNVAAGCRSVNAVLVYLSTDYVFDGSKEAPYTTAIRSSKEKLRYEIRSGGILSPGRAGCSALTEGISSTLS